MKEMTPEIIEKYPQNTFLTFLSKNLTFINTNFYKNVKAILKDNYSGVKTWKGAVNVMWELGLSYDEEMYLIKNG